MKIWNSYGSEHSAHLVIIGTFKQITDAEQARKHIEALTSLALESSDDQGNIAERESIRNYCFNNSLPIAPKDIEDFIFEYRITSEGKNLIIKTNELNINGFLSTMLKYNVKIEIASE